MMPMPSAKTEIFGILGSDFQGVETDFEPFQAAADFLQSARKLTLGPSDTKLSFERPYSMLILIGSSVSRHLRPGPRWLHC
jgi:hypothetical protein